MKRIKLILVCGLVLALTGLTTLVVAAGAQRDTKATVRSVHGDVTYQADGMGPFLPLKVNMVLTPKTVLKSGPGADAWLAVNGSTSTVKLTEKTTVTLSKMEATGMDTSTDLKLDGGTLLGSVRKLSANSEYQVTVPQGVAGIRGTDFQVTVTFMGNGVFTLQFTSVTGTVVCQVTVPQGQMGTQTLTTGQQWTVTVSTTGPNVTLTAPITLPPGVLTDIMKLLPPPPPPPGGVTPPPPSPPAYVPPTTSGSETGGNSSSSSSSGGNGP
jgi:hypothetical protein